MNFFEWQKRQAGRPIYLYLGIGGLVFSFYGGHRYIYKPWKAKQRLAEAKEYADLIKTYKNQ